LFQEVRERRGLAYSVYSFGLGYSDAGMVGVAAGSLPGKATDLLRVVRTELARVAADGLTEEEVERGRGQARGGLVLSLEDSGSRMTRLGEAALFQHRLLSVDEVLSRVEAVSVPDVHALAQELYTRPQTLAQVGPA
jgi:predicted Zn-dependent peptidase